MPNIYRKRIKDLTIQDVHAQFPYATQTQLEAYLQEANDKLDNRQIDDADVFYRVQNGALSWRDLTLEDVVNIPAPNNTQVSFSYEDIKKLYSYMYVQYPMIDSTNYEWYLEAYRNGETHKYSRGYIGEEMTGADILNGIASSIEERNKTQAFLEFVAEDCAQAIKQGKPFVEYVNSLNHDEGVANWREFCDDISIEKLQDLYPDVDIIVQKRFIEELTSDWNHSFIDFYDPISLIKEYPRAFVIDKEFLIIAGELQKHQKQVESNGSEQHKKVADFFKRVLNDFSKPQQDISHELPQSTENISFDPANSEQLADAMPRSIPYEMPQSVKELHQEITQTLSELKLLQRECYEQWNSWQQVKEEWISCALDEDNISHRARWSVEGFQRQIHFNRESQMPASINCRTHETFRQPDESVSPVPQIEISTNKTTNKLINFLMPERETPRLQGELKLLINNVNVMRDYVNSLDKSIFEMRGEISQMRGSTAKAKSDLEWGKPIKDWIRLNLSAETKALGLDPEFATGQDLVKALCRNAPQQQPIQEAAMELE